MKFLFSFCFVFSLFIVNGQNYFPGSGPVRIGTSDESLTHPLNIKPTKDGQGIYFMPPPVPAAPHTWSSETFTIAKNEWYPWIYEMNTETRLDLHGGHQLFMFANDIYFEGNAVVTRNDLTDPTTMSGSISSGTMPFEVNTYTSATGHGTLRYAGLQNIPSTTNEGAHRVAFKMNSLTSDLSGGTEVLNVQSNGSVGINTVDTKSYQLAVNGAAIFTKAVVRTYATWSDYVFDKSYKLPTLQEVENYIQLHNHLPDVPSTAEVEKNGIDLGDNQALLLKKVEELTLYMIEQNKKLEAQQAEIEKQQKQILKLTEQVSEQKSK